MKIGVVGGGWAGLSAAVTAVKQGHEVHLFESARILGGRARSAHAPALDTELDNGQHILLGAYTATLALMRELGLNPAERFLWLPLNVRSADGTVKLRSLPGLPAPLHVAGGLLLARGLTWEEKLAALRAMSRLRRNEWRSPPGMTVQRWLDTCRQPRRLQQLLWHPLCIATMNTPPEQACAQLFANVLRDSLGARTRAASDMLLPRTPLSELWPERVEAWAREFGHPNGAASGCLRIFRSTTIRRLHYAETGYDPFAGFDTARRQTPDTPPALGDPQRDDRYDATLQIDDRDDRYDAHLQIDDRDDRYDAIVICTNTPSAQRLLATLPPGPESREWLERLSAFDHAPIATFTVELERAWHAPAPMLLLQEDRPRHQFGQWLFQGHDRTRNLLHVVVSDAGALMRADRQAAMQGMIDQLQEQLHGQGLPAIIGNALIIEKRATFLAVPGLHRPRHQTPWRGVWVAGDWTDTGYPAVLEGAVRSGRDAVLEMQADFAEESR